MLEDVTLKCTYQMKISVVTIPPDVQYLRQIADLSSAGAEADNAVLSKTNLLVLDGAILASSREIIEALPEVQDSHVFDVARITTAIVTPVVRAAAAVAMQRMEQESPIRDHASIVAASIAPAFHLFPYNRRLDTNGVDDALILSSALFDVRQLVPKPVDILVPQVLPVVPAPELMQLMPEIEPEALHGRESGLGSEDHVEGPAVPDDLVLEAALPDRELVATSTTVVLVTAAIVSQTRQSRALPASPRIISILMSNQRHIRMVERAAFWVWLDMVRVYLDLKRIKDNQTISAIYQPARRILSGVRASQPENTTFLFGRNQALPCRD